MEGQGQLVGEREINPSAGGRLGKGAPMPRRTPPAAAGPVVHRRRMTVLEREAALGALTYGLCEACRGGVGAFLDGDDGALDAMCGRDRPRFDARIRELMGAYQPRPRA